jgi:hypothetical protein
MGDRRRAALRLSAALWALLALLLPAASAPGQDSPQAVPEARKLSEYVNQFTPCNAGGHLDYLAIELQNDASLRGHILVYGPGGLNDAYGRRAADVTKDYLVNTRSIEESRVEAVYAGPYRTRGELLTELWLVPEGAEPPRAVEYENDDEAFKGKFAEVRIWDNMGESGEGWGNSKDVALVGLADLLRRRPEVRAVLAAYHDQESTPGMWRRATAAAVELMGRHGVEAGRVEVIFAGYRKEASADLWVLPRGARPSVAAARERRPDRAVQLGTFSQYRLKWPDEARDIFEGFAEALKADAELNACLVVWLPYAGPPTEEEEAEAAPVPAPDEPPHVNLARLAEQWRDELKSKYGVGGQRVTLIFVPAPDEWGGDAIETWVVPRGAAPPDPYGPGEEPPVEAAEGNPEE